MGLLKDLFKLLMGLAAGFALGYAAVSWLLGQERRLSGAAGPGAHGDDAAPAAAGDGLLDQTVARFRMAVDEGRRAAAAARSEMQREIDGRSAPATPAL
jgi:hypothetical protein